MVTVALLVLLLINVQNERLNVDLNKQMIAGDLKTTNQQIFV